MVVEVLLFNGFEVVALKLTRARDYLPCVVVTWGLSSDWLWVRRTAMKGQKVVSNPKNARKAKSSGSTAGAVVGAVAMGACSPADSKLSKPSKFDASTPQCTGCGIYITVDVRALQCDRCEGWDKWKCVECLGITADVFDALYDCKDIFWFCQGCNGEAVKVADHKEDRVLTILEKMMEKLCGMEDKLHEKADRRSVEDLDSRVRKLEAYVADSEYKVNELVDRVKQVDDRMIAVGDKCVQVQHRGAVSGRDDDVDRDEKREIERRRNNMVLYRVSEVDSEEPEDRKAGDMLVVHELCREVFDVEVDSGDIEGMYRLGKREVDKVRPLLVKFSSDDLKRKVMGRTKELKNASDKFKGISVAHDLTPKQRALVKEVREKALGDLQVEQQAGTASGNVRIIVVGQTSGKPRAVRVPLRGYSQD